MSHVPAKIASALFVTAAIGLGAATTGLPDSTAKAADGCVTEPKGATPEGKHWYYRMEHGTGHKCWYLRVESEQSARAEKPAARRQDTETEHSIADARAELSPRAAVADDAPPSVWPNPPAATAAPDAVAAPAPSADNNDEATSSTLASRWPQSADATSANPPPANPAPANPAAAPSDRPAEASLMVADADRDPNADATLQQVAVPPLPVVAVSERYTGSIHQLLLVAFGALALAGLTGSAVYRLGRRRKRGDWLRERTNWQSTQNPRNPPWVEPQLARPTSTTPDLDDLAALRGDVAPAMDEVEDSEDHVEKIEEFLARLSRQLHEEMEGTGGRRSAHARS